MRIAYGAGAVALACAAVWNLRIGAGLQATSFEDALGHYFGSAWALVIAAWLIWRARGAGSSSR